MKTKLVNENFKSDWVNNLLIARGVNPDNFDKLKNPTEENLTEPCKLNNIQAAAEVILDAVHNKKHIGLIIDCD